MHVPMYELSEVVKCEKCGKVVAEPKELVQLLIFTS
jgi:formylmethanofuran dehydrogenase subunit E